MKRFINKFRRIEYLATALLLTVIMAAPALISSPVDAISQITGRKIAISTSAASATGVSYQLTFTPPDSGQELIVDFCGDTPLIGATCAFSTSTVPNVASVTSSVGTATAIGSGTPQHTIKVTGLTMTGGSQFTITFNAITNPSTVTSFYARVLTYTTGNASGYVPANTTGGSTTTGTYVDYGGVALSTVQQISITATVYETLTFCVSGSTISSCSTTTTPSITIGHGTPLTIGTSQVDINSAYTELSTNAQSGAVVNMKATNSCANGGLSSTGGSACSVAGVGSTAATISAGAGKWGMCIGKGSNTTVATNYNDSVNNCPTTYNSSSLFGMNGTNLTGTYGDQIFSVGGPVTAENNTCTFVATAAATTPAGIYTAGEQLIATGTF